MKKLRMHRKHDDLLNGGHRYCGVAAIVGISAIAGGMYSANKQKGAAEDASNAQIAAGDRGIAEQHSQFEAIQKLLSPYVNAGTGALTGQQNLLGLNGNDAQQQAINGIQNSSQFNALAQQGEGAMLQNASATGGLRGGNTQAALAQFRPALLNGLIDQQYQRLGGLSSMGQNAAAGVGNAGMATGNAITQLLQQQGAAQAGSSLAAGKAYGQMGNSVASGIGSMFGGGMGGMGGLTGMFSGGGNNGGTVANNLF